MSRTLRLLTGVSLCAAAAQADAQAISERDALLLQRAACGAELPENQGLLFGVLRGPDLAPRAGVLVAAIWTEAVLTTRVSETQLRATIDSTGADGSFALCGVPHLTQVTVRAEGVDERTGELLIDIGIAEAFERHLVAGPATPTAAVLGRLVSPAGTPLRGTLDLPGDSVAPVITDSMGNFRVDGVPRRSSQLRVRVIGYLPREIDVAPDGPLVELGEVEMPQPVQELNRVLIEETFMSQDRRGFEDRRKAGVGLFLDDEYFRRWAIPSANTIKLASPRIRGSSGPRGDVLTLRSMSGFTRNGTCFPVVFLDGTNIGRQGPAPNSNFPGGVFPDQMRQLLQLTKRMEIYEASLAPAEYADFAGCGSIVIWTR